MKYEKDWCTSTGIFTSLTTISDNVISPVKGLYSSSCINKSKAKETSQIFFINFFLNMHSLWNGYSSLLNIKLCVLVLPLWKLVLSQKSFKRFASMIWKDKNVTGRSSFVFLNNIVVLLWIRSLTNCTSFSFETFCW